MHVSTLYLLYEAEPPYAPAVIRDSQAGGYRSVSDVLLVLDLLVRGRAGIYYVPMYSEYCITSGIGRLQTAT